MGGCISKCGTKTKKKYQAAKTRSKNWWENATTTKAFGVSFALFAAEALLIGLTAYCIMYLKNTVNPEKNAQEDLLERLTGSRNYLTAGCDKLANEDQILECEDVINRIVNLRGNQWVIGLACFFMIVAELALLPATCLAPCGTFKKWRANAGAESKKKLLKGQVQGDGDGDDYGASGLTFRGDEAL